MNILIVTAHPDDLIFGGCCGFALLSATANVKITHLSITKGELACPHNPESRIIELQEIYQTYDFEIICGNLPDGDLFFSKNMISKLLKYLDKRKFNCSILQWPNDSHIDHHHAYYLGLRISRNIRSILLFESWSCFDFQGNIYIDISSVWKQRLSMISKLKVHPIPQANNRLTARALVHGSNITLNDDNPKNLIYAEAFSAVRLSFLDFVKIFKLK